MSGGWNTIESDAGVFTYLIEKLGVKDVQFEELLMLEAEELERLSPVYGVIFLFKYPTETASIQSPQNRDQPLDGSYDYAAAEDLFFASQVIQNACGTQALLSVLLNKDSSIPTSNTEPHTDIVIGPHLTEFKSFTSSFPPSLRGECLSNSEIIRTVHNSFARSSPFFDDTTRPATGADEEDVYHFIAYTAVNNTLYELDGLQPAPISHGPCNTSNFPSAVIPVLQRRIARYPATEIRFNLLAMVRDQRVVARERGNWDGVEREDAKRREWMWENGLRKHSFLGLATEVLKAVVRDKLEKGGEEGYNAWVQEAVNGTKRKIEARKARREAGEGMEVDT